MKVVIVEDEELAQRRLIQLIQAFSDSYHIIGTADLGENAIYLINREKPDLLFMDIQLPDMSGFDVLKALDYRPMIIFTTAYQEYAIKAFDHLAIDYLLKPITLERLKNSLLKISSLKGDRKYPTIEKLEEIIKEVKTSEKSTLTLKLSDRIKIIPVQEICYAKAEDKYVNIHTVDGKTYLSNKSLTKLAAELPSQFSRVHKSYIVNKNYVTELEKYFKGTFILYLNDAKRSKIKTGEHYRKTILEVFQLR